MSTRSSTSLKNFKEGNRLYKGKLFEEALSAYQKSIEENLSFYEGHFCIAKTLIRLHKVEEGIAYFNKYRALIPDQKQVDFVFGFAKILMETHQSEAAFQIAEPYFSSASPGHQHQIYRILLANGKIREVIRLWLNLSPEDFLVHKNDIAADQNLPPSIKDALRKITVVETFQERQNRYKILKKNALSDVAYESELEKLDSLITEMKQDPQLDYQKQIEKIEDGIWALQNCQDSFAEGALDSQKPQTAETAIKVLEKTAYDRERITYLKEVSQSVRQFKKRQKRRNEIRFVLLFIGAILLGFIIQFFVDRSRYLSAVKKNDTQALYAYITQHDLTYYHKEAETRLGSLLLAQGMVLAGERCQCIDQFNETAPIAIQQFEQDLENGLHPRQGPAKRALSDLTKQLFNTRNKCMDDADARFRSSLNSFSRTKKAASKLKESYEKKAYKCPGDQEGSVLSDLEEIEKRILTIKDPLPTKSEIQSDLVGQKIQGWEFKNLSEIKELSILKTIRKESLLECKVKLKLRREGADANTNCEALIMYQQGYNGWNLQSVSMTSISYTLSVETDRWTRIDVLDNCSYKVFHGGKKYWIRESLGFFSSSYKGGPGEQAVSFRRDSFYLKSREERDIYLTVNFRPNN